MNAMTPELKDLNRKLAAVEQQRDHEFFSALLSEKLVFRRANGAVIGKAEFLQELQKPTPFVERIVESIEVTELPAVPDRALVILIVRRRKADSTTQRFQKIRFFTRTAAG